jgi:hypothetical protein
MRILLKGASGEPQGRDNTQKRKTESTNKVRRESRKTTTYLLPVDTDGAGFDLHLLLSLFVCVVVDKKNETIDHGFWTVVVEKKSQT